MENKLDVMKLMNDQMKAVVVKQSELVENAFDTSVGLEKTRENYIKERVFWNEGGPVMAKTEEITLEGPLGAFMVRLYYPVLAETLPVIEFIHGGGFMLGNPDTHDRACRVLAEKTGACVASVDYHLSPESRFPANIKECAQVARYLHEHGNRLGIDGDDIAFAGDSGGAFLSLATNLWLRDEEGDNSFITCLMLYYGAYGLTDSMSFRLFGNDLDGMRREDYMFYMGMYLNDVETEVKSPYFDMLSNDLETSMPPCYVAAAGLDPLRDDSACLAAILENNAVRCRHEVFDGVLHAFIHHTRMLDAANECIEHSAAFWKERHE